ncbi:Endonuclease/exonuclease/phosphatase, partial [Cerioporus squamosus]
TKYPSSNTPVFTLRIISWNVDFMAPDPAGRMARILDHLQEWVLTYCPKPSCILLQELTEESFEALLRSDWVQEHFVVTPPNTKRWRTSYGLATLVSRHARVRNAQMLQFHRTTMGRGALFVDIEMFVPGSMGETRVVRIANTHLESLPEGERSRPAQLCAIADLLRDKAVTGGGLVGGDMNMIGPADQDIHVRAGLIDGCANETPADYTWGWQPRTRFPPGRLDRIFFRGDRIQWSPVQVIGRGVKTRDTEQWVSDHFGLVATVELVAA